MKHSVYDIQYELYTENQEKGQNLLSRSSKRVD